MAKFSLSRTPRVAEVFGRCPSLLPASEVCCLQPGNYPKTGFAEMDPASRIKKGPHFLQRDFRGDLSPGIAGGYRR